MKKVLPFQKKYYILLQIEGKFIYWKIHETDT